MPTNRDESTFKSAQSGFIERIATMFANPRPLARVLSAAILLIVGTAWLVNGNAQTQSLKPGTTPLELESMVAQADELFDSAVDAKHECGMLRAAKPKKSEALAKFADQNLHKARVLCGKVILTDPKSQNSAAARMTLSLCYARMGFSKQARERQIDLAFDENSKVEGRITCTKGTRRSAKAMIMSAEMLKRAPASLMNTKAKRSFVKEAARIRERAKSHELRRAAYSLQEAERTLRQLRVVPADSE